jgi:hypothetical protein
MIFVFTGPTLAGCLPDLPPGTVILPPVSQGDLYRAAARRPGAIAIIDGYFDHVPAVTHKEILWAMSQGVHVFGAASMGALRAAELNAFGMEGVGKIFAAYRDGVFEDDDEVAVAHGTEEDGFRPASEAMVNIRATLEVAARAEIITSEESARLCRFGKSLFYPRRHYTLLLEHAEEWGMSRGGVATFRSWLTRERVDQKREDALELLSVLAARFQVPTPKKQVSYTLNRTEMWDFVMRQVPSGVQGAGSEWLRDEVRLLGSEMYRDIWDRALLRALASADASRLELPLSPDTLDETSRTIERQRGTKCFQGQDFGNDEHREFLANEARLHLIRKVRHPETEGQLEIELWARGILDNLSSRARDKNQTLDRLGTRDPDLVSSGLTMDELVAWFFQRIGQPAPRELIDYTAALDLPGTDLFIRLLLREYVFARERQGHVTVG